MDRSARRAPARDGEPIRHQSNGQDWLQTWHPPTNPPDGLPHGAAGVCIADDGLVVIISEDGEHWDLPAGRPEGQESLEETLRREMLEEACATVTHARLLGYARGECLAGHERGRILVRSIWRADVVLAAWEPAFEIQHRRLVPAADLVDAITVSDGLARIVSRALDEAGLV